MSMNLIQIQDKLKSLPNDPRVMQLLTGYANGQNPQVPPYLALGELNRRKVEGERMKMEQAGQPPGGTIKDQIAQQAGVMALQQGRQQQAMQQMAQQGMQGGAPQGAPQQPVMAAASGGLASLRPGYRSGGIIAFQEAGSVDDAVQEAEGGGEDNDSAGNYSTDPKALFAQLMQEAAARRNIKPPKVESRDETRKRMIETEPERYGILNKPLGEDSMARLEELQRAKRAELATQKEELAKSKPGILQLLGQAAMNSRGQQGRSALASILGGYSELATGAEAKQLQQEQGLRMRELELQQARAEALNKVEDAQRSQAEGNIDKAQKDMQDAQKIAKDHNVSLNTLLGRQLTTAGTLVESQRKSEDTTRNIKSREDVAAERRKLDERLENLRANRPGEKERILRQIDKLRKDGKTAEAAQLLEDLRYLQGSAVGVNLARNERLIIEAQLKTANNVLTNSRSTPAEIAVAKAEIAELNKQLKGLSTKPDGAEESTPKPITPTEFDAKWKTLQKGQTLVGPDGKTYTKG